jgi:N-acetylglutamate synthase-like GNAT family acetyltransferase
MNKFEISVLSDNNSPYIKLITDWMYKWWGEQDGWSVDRVNCYVKNCVAIDKIPQTIIAVTGDKIVGTCNLIMHDLDSRPDIYPWLANLFVDEDYRLQGVATGLINQAIKQAKKLGLKELYLYTKYTDLYEKFGFEFVEEVETFKKDSPIERLYKISL